MCIGSTTYVVVGGTFANMGKVESARSTRYSSMWHTVVCLMDPGLLDVNIDVNSNLSFFGPSFVFDE